MVKPVIGCWEGQVPRYRFDWSNIAADTLRPLAPAAGCAGDEPAAGLRDTSVAAATEPPDTTTRPSPTPAGRRRRISKPRRKHVGLATIAESPEGQAFLSTLTTLIGTPTITALGKIGDTHLFLAEGDIAAALVLEEQAVKHDDATWHSRVAFRTSTSPQVDAVLHIARWDPWLAFDHQTVQAASRSQRQEWDAHRAERAATSDTLELTNVSSDQGLLTLDAEELVACWERAIGSAPGVSTDESPAADSPAPERGETEAVRQRVLALLQRVSDDPDLGFDEDGDIPLRFGSSAVFVRVFGTPPVIRVYAPALAQVPSDSRVSDLVNSLNSQTTFTKWLSVDNTIYAAIDLFATPLVEAHVVHACHVVGDTADHLDDQLQDALGGKTFFGEYSPPKLPETTPGYL